VKRLIATLVLAAAALALAACSSTNADSATPSASAGPADPNAPVIVAKDMKFTTAEVTVSAGKPLQVTFQNQDGAPHNVSIFTDSSASKVVFQGEIFGGPATKTYSVPALAAGTYFFRCDVHPDMTGTIVAK
jgi:plastocyanin